jgi:hypothetical protein
VPVGAMVFMPTELTLEVRPASLMLKATASGSSCLTLMEAARSATTS